MTCEHGPLGWGDVDTYCSKCWEENARLRAVLTDGHAFWDAVYPHITEYGPDLNLADCEEITRWLRAALGVSAA